LIRKCAPGNIRRMSALFRRIVDSRHLFAPLLLGAALTLAGCGPSIDAAAKADVDGRVAALHASGQSFPAPSGFVPMPLGAGQWTQHKLTNDKGEPSFITYKILRQEGDAFVIEMVHEGYTGKSVQQMTVAFGNRMDPAQIEVRTMKMKDTKGRVNELPPSVMPMMQSLYKSAVSMLVVNWQGMPQEDASVPAGNFSGCYRVRTDAQWAGFRSVSDSWSHPSVPLSGMVKSKGVDKPTTMELVAFGLSGAVSEF
jgi:hypothetical protein